MNMRLGLALLAAFNCAGVAAQTLAGDAKQGEVKASVCAACHGVDGNSSDPQYPKLAGQHERYTARQLALYKSGARPNPVMMGFAATLSEQDMVDIGAYFATQQPKPDVVDPELAVVGERLFRAGDAARGIPACLACHGPAGRGNPGPAYPALNGQHSEYVEAQLKLYRDGAVYGDPSHLSARVMADVARNMSDADIVAVSAYVKGLYQE